MVGALCSHLFKNNQAPYNENAFSAEGGLIYSPFSLNEVWLSEPEHEDKIVKMQAQCDHQQECKCIRVCFDPALMPPDSFPGVATALDDDNVHSSSHVEMSASEGGFLPDHPKVADDGDCDHDSVLFIGLNVVDSDPDPSPPVVALERDHCESPLLNFDANNIPGHKSMV